MHTYILTYSYTHLNLAHVHMTSPALPWEYIHTSLTVSHTFTWLTRDPRILGSRATCNPLFSNSDTDTPALSSAFEHRTSLSFNLLFLKKVREGEERSGLL